LLSHELPPDAREEEDEELSRLLAQVEEFSQSGHSGKQDLFNFRELLLEVAQSVFMRWKVFMQLRSMALTDDLTGLYNRRGFFHLGMQTIRLAIRSSQPLLLFYADVDRLKMVNDHHGHIQGDAFLVGCGEILKMTFREADIVARIGGDEFAILVQGGTSESRDVVLDRIASSVFLMNRDVLAPHQLSLSVGVARFDPANPISLLELLRSAEREMLHQKRLCPTAGPTCSQFSGGTGANHAAMQP
jgi:diguanylate cyclase (GGDEF)-like protein